MANCVFMVGLSVSSDIDASMFKMSSAFRVTVDGTYVTAILPKDQKGIHVLQFRQPLTKEAPYFMVEVKRKGKKSSNKSIAS